MDVKFRTVGYHLPIDSNVCREAMHSDPNRSLPGSCCFLPRRFHIGIGFIGSLDVRNFAFDCISN